jgi:hypothetical protein
MERKLQPSALPLFLALRLLLCAAYRNRYLLQLLISRKNCRLADIELVTAEMMVINAAERAILEELERR